MMLGFYQVLSRNNDHNGNPYRLCILYSTIQEHPKVTDGWPKVIDVRESQSSTPNIVEYWQKCGYYAISGYHLSIQEYKAVKAWWAHKGLLKDDTLPEVEV